ncbi:DUF930 domain-containing protein [Kaistia dalseonensis]|uniref:DUF930 domain-containing protein n=1 Tax=Kaistia dalseonensis TaxID=410840 RepID=A0ABU0HCU2_9HYPH|nr:DUF930 domain-containing protein [Kaistia dalseonensis]MCX5497492.1 DUF930 domain-containing protein [Kaistia dalseonensis]MDQ0440131.1 hypothetical protein [Kaistia dalseonensis]
MQPFPRAAPQPTDDPTDTADRLRWSIAAALCLHALLIVVLALLPAERPPPSLPEGSVAVSIVTPGEFDSLVPPRLKATETQPPADNAAQPSDAMKPATQLYSDQMLADPRSRQAREALPHLAPDERIIQLCNIEALAQIHSADAARFQPDIVVAYAMAELKLSDHAMEADGGAFRSKRQWYAIGYRCAVTPDLAKVVSFALHIGKPIPRREWASHELTIDDEPAD